MDNFRQGMTIPATRYIQALRVRKKTVGAMQRIFSEIDLLVVPATLERLH
jgi:Asp-tRNA(Asn)/Glu-tRNA(Gln) amidotransferase A subunit family amidase